MAVAAGGYVAPLFVQVFPPDVFAAKLVAKLEIYFQSPKKSGGGECNVRMQDRELGIYSVRFWSEEVKKRVKAHHGHTIEVGGITLEIRILSDSEFAMVDAAETVFTNSVIGSLSTSCSPNFLTIQNDFKNKYEEIYAAGHKSARKRIFLEVSAILNTDLLTKEQRNQVIAVCPSLKIDSASSHLGIEKVVGQYEDIEKLHNHFEKLLRGHCDSEFLQPKKQDNCVEGKEDHSRRYRSKDTEELAKMEVPLGIFEYFEQAYKEEIKKIEETFGVKLVTGNTENGITSVWFSSTGVPNFTKEAQEEFVLLFQKVAGDLKQETVAFIESHSCEMIKSKCKHIIIKKYKDTTVFQGPTKEISDIKALLDEMTANSWNKKNPHIQPSGIEVDADVFAFLKPKLIPKVELINNKYCTRMEEKHCYNDHLTCIIFMPQTYAPADLSSQASEDFQYEYLQYLETPQMKTIPLNVLEDWKRKLKDLFRCFQHEHPKVELSLRENYLLICGLPENILLAEKHIMVSLKTEEFVAKNSEAMAIPDCSVGAATGTSFGSSRCHKMQQVPSQVQPVGKATEVQQDEFCPMCLNTILQKDVLPKCKHTFCAKCAQMNCGSVCPVCNPVYGKLKGNHPMEVIMKSLNGEKSVAVNNEATAIPDSSVGAATSISFDSQRYHEMQQVPSQELPLEKASEVQPEECCPICLNTIHQKKVLTKCKHAFCAACIGTAMNYKPVCPVCSVVYGNIKGNQPPGKMDIIKTRSSLPGHENSGTITINYHIFDGIQTERHPHPGKPFYGTSRKAYLPDNKEGREILKLLQRAFRQDLIFTVGQSQTTGANDVVTWNDIHHKTSIYGGEKNFGYPDHNYLKRVREELKAKGIE